MDSKRLAISDAVWACVGPRLPGKISDCGVSAPVLGGAFRLRASGNWNSVFQCFRRWAHQGVFDRLFEVVSEEVDFGYALIDGATVSVHQKASGAKGGLAISPSGGRPCLATPAWRPLRRQGLRYRLAEGGTG